jgi:Protein of unknown function (DUF433)
MSQKTVQSFSAKVTLGSLTELLIKLVNTLLSRYYSEFQLTQISVVASRVRGLRYPVEFLLELLSSGMTHEEILADYNDLEEADILATLLDISRI